MMDKIIKAGFKQGTGFLWLLEVEILFLKKYLE